ncbi:MAG: hypothetical protein L0Y80_06335 [Ignavibacteriae bacterium]|nr:hypothetical protein [Ignavibacteriota bacterium]
MKTLLRLGLSMLVALAIPASLQSQGLVKTMLHSDTLKQDRALGIHLPSSYDSTRKYPVVYVLDGLSQSEHIFATLDSLSKAGLVPPAIVVAIPNMSAQNRQRQLIPPYMKLDHEKPESPTGDADRFLAFMEHELFPFIERTYSASNVRTFAGNSRGGLLVMHSLVYKPEMFQARFCFSTPFWREDNLIVFKVTEVLRSTNALQTFLYISAGEDETDNIKGGLAAMSAAFKEHASNGIVWYAEYTPNANHQTNAKLSAPSAILRWAEYVK